MLRKQALTVIPDGRKGQQQTKDSDKFVKSIHRQSRSHRCSCTAAVIMILNEGVEIQKNHLNHDIMLLSHPINNGCQFKLKYYYLNCFLNNEPWSEEYNCCSKKTKCYLTTAAKALSTDNRKCLALCQLLMPECSNQRFLAICHAWCIDNRSIGGYLQQVEGALSELGISATFHVSSGLQQILE